MQLTEENSTLLYHYCKEIADALRPILNTKQFDNVDDNYWIEKLSEFKNILLQILQTEMFPPSAPTPFIDLTKLIASYLSAPASSSSLFDTNTITVFKTLIDSVMDRKRYDSILNDTLQTMMMEPTGGLMSMKQRIETAFDITEEVMAKLKERNQ